MPTSPGPGRRDDARLVSVALERGIVTAEEPGAAVVVQDRDGVLVDATDAALRLLGLDRGQLVGRSSLDARWETVDLDGSPVRGEDHPAMRALRTGGRESQVLGVHRPGTDTVGRHVWLDVVSTPHGADAGVVTVLREVLGVRADALRSADAERLYRLLAESASDLVSLIGLDGTVQWASPASTALLGRTPESLAGTPAVGLTHPDDRAAVRAAMALAATGATPDTVTARLRHEDGSWVWTETTVAVITDQAGTPAQLRTASRDVTRRVAAERARRQSDRFLASVLEHAPVGIAVRPLDGTLTRVNRAMAEMLRRDPADLVGIDLVDLLHPDHPGPVDDGVAALLDGERDRVVSEWPLLRGDGTTLWGRHTVVLLVDDSGAPEHVLVQLEDVTEARAAAAALARAAVTDALTGLPHRAVLDDLLATALAAAAGADEEVGVLFIDLDHFKQINDTRGHDVGDAVLREVARRLRATVRAHDTVVRLGGDEFVVVCPAVTHGTECEDLVRRVEDCLAAPLALDGGPLAITASVGAVTASTGTGGELVRAADAAMYERKRRRREPLQRSARPAGPALGPAASALFPCPAEPGRMGP